jgi:hypothetical protein
MTRPNHFLSTPTRRDVLYGLGATLGSVAFNAMLRAEASKAVRPGPLAVKPQQVPAKAKNCIFLFMEGGPSHIDTFDPKPKLDELHLKKFTRQDKFASAMASGTRYYVKSPWGFKRHGAGGLWMADRFAHLPKVADELLIYHGLQAESINHPTACYHINTGSQFGGEPAVGAWTTYGLGSDNQDLPGFIVLPEVSYPQGGAANWSNGYLPAYYQGTTLRPTGSAILDLNPPAGVTRQAQRANLDLLAQLNASHQARHPQHDELAARMESYELAYRMQASVPDLIDLGKESQATRQMYGMDEPDSADFGRKCLLARRLVEKGVRFVQVYTLGWDSHDYLEKAHGSRIKSVDKPIAGLITDLKQRGLLDSTLIVWCGEFGRSADNGVRGGAETAGRDHNAKAMAVWFAGGGLKTGRSVGATDDLGQQAVECVHPIRDLHVTILRMLGLDDNKLTYFHAGRFKQLSQIGGEPIKELLA